MEEEFEVEEIVEVDMVCPVEEEEVEDGGETIVVELTPVVALESAEEKVEVVLAEDDVVVVDEDFELETAR